MWHRRQVGATAVCRTDALFHGDLSLGAVDHPVGHNGWKVQVPWLASDPGMAR
jgi:hypothetical protein